MAIDIAGLLAARQNEKYALHDKYLNSQLVRVLKTIGYDVNFSSGTGAYLYDREGRRFLDLLSGFGVFAIGRNHPTVIAALKQVLDAGMANLVQLDVSPLAGLLAERLLGWLPGMERLFFCNSGAEAVESAIKFARAATGRAKIVYCDHAFHGLTYGALSVNGTDVFRTGFGPLLGDCVRVPFDDLPALEAALAGSDVAAFIVEPIQGKGVHIPSDEYLPGAARLCRRYGTLFVADEIQTGIGRTGRFLALEHWGVEPDMVLLAKALSGGFVPVGAVAMKEWIFSKLFDRMDRALVHGSTFGKNDLAMAAALATLEVIEAENLIARSAATGAALLADLQALTGRYELLKDVRGKGLMIGLEFGAPHSFALKTAWHLLESANKGLFCQMVLIPLFRDHHILCQVSGPNIHVIKLLPSLVIDETDRVWIRDAFDAVIADCHRVPGAVWDLGRTLAGHSLRSRAGAA
ncbi:aminotransferase class III-fold pyridoxal phosphate-dependent enzyme [Mesorhizobium sp. BAC0120]|uniref:aspartate aminotransferase family protein n=1 Tax=Mesorhizobium sp. BAC0120 TaxID=3090670 RepID=UPI00298CCA1B|nr:aminotransferase class III-fold pyridoxal phosphate-dependent enzyme [Mesorhizobium sp. BAC0120]MDW6026156.1 aminotransferase class III-fold pyridoxal phosphate-dependent enzyme [Mesorhizobium sp. BAC0120]